VSYEGGWFNGDEKKGETEEETSPSKAQRTKKWFNKMATSVKEKTKPLTSNIKDRAVPKIDNLKEKARPKLSSLKEKANSIRQNINEKRILSNKQIESEKSFDSTDAATETLIPEKDEGAGPNWLNTAESGESAVFTADILPPSDSMTSEGNDSAVKPSVSINSQGSTLSDFSDCQMNPAMKELIQKKQEENPSKTMNPAMAKILNQKAEQEAWEKKKKDALSKLPKADPPKLVLARTHWLLQHGEAILPACKLSKKKANSSR
jgi:hypothetical protein